MFIQNIFITETSNYTKRILHSQTDHYTNTRAKNWKKLTTEELNGSIACHRSTDNKQEPYMLVRRKPSLHCPWLQNISKEQFPIKPDMFSHGSQERFCYCLGSLFQVSGSYHTSSNLTPE